MRGRLQSSVCELREQAWLARTECGGYLCSPARPLGMEDLLGKPGMPGGLRT